MNATRRWAYHFVASLECVNCRTKTKRRLFNKWGDLLDDIQKWPLEVVKASVDNLEVWCIACAPEGSRPISRRTLSEGRRQHKRDAATLASLRAASQIASRYDTYTLPDGTEDTKQALVQRALDKPCEVCYKEKATKMFLEGTNVAALMSSAQTYAQVQDKLDKAVPCCHACFVLKKNNVI